LALDSCLGGQELPNVNDLSADGCNGKEFMKVLVVEDYLPLRDSIAKGLRAAGFAVDVAADGENALRRATNTT
jgi:PleD family two-component response regulator